MKKLYFILLCLGLFSGLKAQSLPSYLPANGLVGWWPFNGNAQDESGSGNHGTVNGATLTTDRFGNAGKAYDFDGQSNYIITQSATVKGVNSRTVSLWFFLTAINSNTRKILIDEGGFSCNTGFALLLDNRPVFDNTCDYKTFDQICSPGAWNNIILVFNNSSAEQLKCYLNGVEVLTLSGQPTVNSGGAIPLIIGKSRLENNQHFPGKIDDIAIYNRALNQQEITQLYQAGNETSLSYQLSQEKLGNCPTSPVKLSVQTSVKVKTDSAGSIGSSSATAYGNILNDGGKTITRRGFCWGTSANPTLSNSFSENGSGSGTFSGSLSGLSPSSTYYLRAYAGTATEVWYGNEISFTTATGSASSASCGTPNIHNPNLPYGSMSDQDGNSYKTIVIGTQEWMAENLKSSHYSNGEPIPVQFGSWFGINSGLATWYGNDSVSYHCPYGKMYNWFAASDSRNVCPVNWHVPSSDEWSQLILGLGGESISGGKLKSTSSQFWSNGNAGASNESGFSALPGGFRFGEDGATFDHLSNYVHMWTSSENSPQNGFTTKVESSSTNTYLGAGGKYSGFYIRCLKDAPETGRINSLDCGADLNLGQIFAGQLATGATSKLSYTGGNGGSYAGQVIASTGVTGLTAFFSGGRFALGDSSITLNISGTPSATGHANFLLNIGGQAFTITRIVIATGTGATDVDGNQYPSVIIGNQEWMSENLKVSKYRNGDHIRTNLSDSAWANLGFTSLNNDNPINPVGAYSEYDTNNSLVNIYGRLYNYYSVADPRNLCPAGWRVPTDTDWNELGSFLGCPSYAGQKMKATGTIQDGTGLWDYYYDGSYSGTNESGFNAFPGGFRGVSGFYTSTYTGLGQIGIWRSATDIDEGSARFYLVWSNNPTFNGYTWNKNDGYSVRCIRGEAADSAHIELLDCSGMDTTGLLLEQTAVSGFTYFTIPYSGGNASLHPGQRIASTGVTGLTATLFAGQFANGSGLLKYYLEGTPDASGNASFAINIGGKTCTINWQVEDRIDSLLCNEAINSGTLFAGQAASNAITTINYTGGNGGSYYNRSIASTGVSGLTATLAAGNFASGNGSLIFSISGTPEAPGIASFALNIGGQSCSFSRPVYSILATASCGTPNIHNPNLTYGTMTDQDGNSYKTIVIGTQEWMAENLKTGHYRNGDLIPIITSEMGWDEPASWWFNNDSVTYSCPYGRYYNWYAVTDPRGICPVGWHFSSDEDWKTLEQFLGMPEKDLDKFRLEFFVSRGDSQNVGGKLKSAESNESGFSALLGGMLYSSFLSGPNSDFPLGFWWTALDYESDAACIRLMASGPGGISRLMRFGKRFGLSARCVKDNLQNGIVSFEKPENAGTIYAGQTISDAVTKVYYTGGNGEGYPEQTVVSAGVSGLSASIGAGNYGKGNGSLIISIGGTPSTPGEAIFTLNLNGQLLTFSRTIIASGAGLTDIDGNPYQSIIIGNQEWMSENLKVSRYRNGDPIPEISTDADWQSTSSGAFGYLNNNPANNVLTGKLYNWYAVNDSRQLCPAGWHEPSDTEWSTLENYLGGVRVAGGKMKTLGTSLWGYPNFAATNESGFSVVPGVNCEFDIENYYDDYLRGCSSYWCSTENSSTNALSRYVKNNAAEIVRKSVGKNAGLSIRCLKD